MTGLRNGRNRRKINQFKKLITTTGLNTKKEFNNHIINLINNNKNGNKITTLFKTFYFTITKIQDKEVNRRLKYDIYYIFNPYYGFGTTFKIKNNNISFCRTN